MPGRKRGGSQGTERLACLWKWKKLVEPHGPWDHKDPIKQKWKGAAYKHAAPKGATSEKNDRVYWFHVDGTDSILSYEFWSNVHYSYVGRVAGITPFELRTGHQLAGAGETDEGDKLIVELGLQLYEATHQRALSVQDILDLVNKNLPELTRKNKAEKIDSTGTCATGGEAVLAALAGEWKDVGHAGGWEVATLTIGADGSVEVVDIGCQCSTEPAQLHDLGLNPDLECQRGDPCCYPAVGPTYAATVQWPAGVGMPSGSLMVWIQVYEDAAGETFLGVNADWYLNSAFTRTGANPTSPACP